MNALTRTIVTDLKARIEFHGNCSVCLQMDQCNQTGEFLGYFAWANREHGGPNVRSNTVAIAWDEAPIACLDKLAAELGVDVSGDAPALVAEAA